MGSALLGHFRNIFFSILCFVFCYLIGSLVDENTIGQGQTSLVMIAMFISFAVHIVLYIPSYIFQTEKFYDLTGSFTYFLTLSAVLYLKYLAVSSNLELRSILIFACVMIWTFRLGSFLFWRVLKDGEDKRFRSILPNFSQLFMTWMLSATWVFIQSLTALVAITTLNKADFGLLGALGLIIWVMGFSVEVVADNQKTKVRSDPNNKDKFITTGLWSLSRHPNYVGEIMLWIGISIMALPVLTGYQYGSLISPLFSFLLIYYVSGVRMLEARANKKWGKNEKYQEYKRNTPIFFPKIPK